MEEPAAKQVYFKTKRIMDYAIFQAIHDLESRCRHRHGGYLQIEAEDRENVPVIKAALQCLRDCGVRIVEDEGYPNIRIDYDRSKNQYFGRG